MRKVWGRLYLAFVLLVFYLPIFYLIVFSFLGGKNVDIFHGFTLSHHIDLFTDGRLLTIFLDTIMLALLSGLIAIITGIMGAIAIDATKNKREETVLLLLDNVSMVSPDVIIGASLLVLFTVLGFSLGFGSVLLSHIAFSIPVVVLMMLPCIKEMNKSLTDVARDPGVSNWQVYSRVSIPAITPGMLSGLFMALTYSLDDFAAAFFVTGNGFTALSIEIYSRARQEIDLEVNALSTLIFLIVLLLVGGYYPLTTRHSHKSDKPEIGGLIK